MPKSSSKKDSVFSDVRIAKNGNYLRLQFSSRVSKVYFGRTQYLKPVGRSDTPENRLWLYGIAQRIQADLDHPDSLFDPTLEKYLSLPKLDLNRGEELKLRDLWDPYCLWKLQSTQIHQTTYQTRYKTFTNWLKPWLNEKIDRFLVSDLIVGLNQQDIHKPNLKRLFSCLKSMGEWGVRQEKLQKNYFLECADVRVKTIKKSFQLQELENYRGFSLQERNLIIETFYNSKEESHAAQLIEFLFLTGCRLGEAFALKASEIIPEGIIFKESYSTETGITKPPKNYKVRLFRTNNYSRLLNLLKDLLRGKRPTDYLFISPNGENYNRLQLDAFWRGKDHGNDRFTKGVVTRLVESGKVNQYLKPSSTRHTFITLQAKEGVDLKLLADSVGNSVDTIYKHYLSSDKSAYFKDI